MSGKRKGSSIASSLDEEMKKANPLWNDEDDSLFVPTTPQIKKGGSKVNAPSAKSRRVASDSAGKGHIELDNEDVAIVSPPATSAPKKPPVRGRRGGRVASTRTVSIPNLHLDESTLPSNTTSPVFREPKPTLPGFSGESSQMARGSFVEIQQVADDYAEEAHGRIPSPPASTTLRTRRKGSPTPSIRGASNVAGGSSYQLSSKLSLHPQKQELGKSLPIGTIVTEIRSNVQAAKESEARGRGEPDDYSQFQNLFTQMRQGELAFFGYVARQINDLKSGLGECENSNASLRAEQARQEIRLREMKRELTELQAAADSKRVGQDDDYDSDFTA